MISVLFIVYATLFLFLLRFEGSGRKPEQGFLIKFGIIEPDAEGWYDVAVETDTLPLLPQDAGFVWGYTVVPPNGEMYTTREALYLPSPPRMIDFPMPVEKKEGGRIIITPNVLRQDYMVHFYGFNEGDPVGDWKLLIYINDQLARSIRFSVVRP